MLCASHEIDDYQHYYTIIINMCLLVHKTLWSPEFCVVMSSLIIGLVMCSVDTRKSLILICMDMYTFSSMHDKYLKAYIQASTQGVRYWRHCL